MPIVIDWDSSETWTVIMIIIRITTAKVKEWDLREKRKRESRVRFAKQSGSPVLKRITSTHVKGRGLRVVNPEFRESNLRALRPRPNEYNFKYYFELTVTFMYFLRLRYCLDPSTPFYSRRLIICIYVSKSKTA